MMDPSQLYSGEKGYNTATTQHIEEIYYTHANKSQILKQNDLTYNHLLNCYMRQILMFDYINTYYCICIMFSSGGTAAPPPPPPADDWSKEAPDVAHLTSKIILGRIDCFIYVYYSKITCL